MELLILHPLLLCFSILLMYKITLLSNIYIYIITIFIIYIYVKSSIYLALKVLKRFSKSKKEFN